MLSNKLCFIFISLTFWRNNCRAAKSAKIQQKNTSIYLPRDLFIYKSHTIVSFDTNKL